MDQYEWVEKNGAGVKGKRECLMSLSGDRITRDQAIKAMAYSCLGYCVDGRQTCSVKICPLRSYCQFYKEV